MKHKKLHIIVVILFLTILGNCNLYAQKKLEISGTWSSNRTISEDTEVTITGNTTLSGKVTVYKGAKLTIKPGDNITDSVTIKFSTTGAMFNVKGTLEILGQQNKRIVLDGGANYTLDTANMTLTLGSAKYASKGIDVDSIGYIKINHCTIKNINCGNGTGACFDINSSTSKTNTIRNCTMYKASARMGTAVMLQGSATLKIEDSKVIGCFSGYTTENSHDNNGGAIRTYGSVSASLYLTRVKFFYNYAQRHPSNFNNTLEKGGNGGALFWNARGKSTTKCVINGCEFGYNKSDDNGGAIKTQGTTIFEGAKTRIHHNTAPIGAGLYIEGYTGGAGVSGVRTIEYDLNEYLEIDHNTSPGYIYNNEAFPGKGAGVHLWFGNKMTLEATSTIKLYMNGAVIKNNKCLVPDGFPDSKSLGGGIYFENTSPSKKNYRFEINLNHGTLSDNTSDGYGGGMYVYKGNINSNNTSAENKLTVEGNKALEGAGIYVDQGNLTMAKGSISENTIKTGATGNGGGIYVKNGNFEIASGDIFKNKSTGKGGGIFIDGGEFKMLDGTISSNTSASEGGGVFVNTGNFNMDNGSIYGNGKDTINGTAAVRTSLGGGVYVNGGNFTMKSGSIYGNTSSGNGGGVFVANGSFNIKNSTGSIVKNRSGADGGGVYVSGGNFNMENGSISSNISTAKGGGVFINTGNFNMDNGEITGNGKDTISSTVTVNTTLGGGVYINGGDFTMKSGSINGNTSSGNGGGVFVATGEFTIKNSTGSIVKNSSDADGGGVYISNGKFTMEKGSISSNISKGDGGGVYINTGNFEMQAGYIKGNGKDTLNSSVTVFTANGGGVFLNSGNFDLITGEISDNASKGNGGGVYLTGDNCVYKLKNGNITLNNARNGAGVYLEKGSFILTENSSQTGTISSNSSTENGGGVYIAGTGGFTMNGGSVTANASASYGGGIYLNGGSFQMNNGKILNNGLKGDAYPAQYTQWGGGVYLNGGTFTQTDGAITGNLADINGGGVCIVNGGNFSMVKGQITGNGKTSGANGEVITVTNDGGGVYIDGGTLSVSSSSNPTDPKATISGNACSYSGGGVYILNGTVEMGAGKISGNTCNDYGGGVYVFNNTGTVKNVTFSGGTIQGNFAKYGGGVCVDGKINLSIENVEIAENIATNGGGVCLMNNANMTFGAGQIKNNTARKNEGSEVYSNTTAYHEDIRTLQGLGGGVYLNSHTTLVFNSASELGLFGNRADNGADEVFANGKNTNVNLPDVSQMKLDGYDGADNLKWIEDYITNDTRYDEGTMILGNSWEGQNLRYRDMINQNMQNIPQLVGGISSTDSRAGKYICFALGYEVIYINVTRNGLQIGESAIFTLAKEGADSFKIIITGNGSNSITKKVAVTAGEWTITETPWSWSYKIAGSGKVISKNVADAANREFIFTDSKGSSLPLHHEATVENTLGGRSGTN